MHLVQVCNVGNLCGGTAACAWSIMRALPDCRHTLLCLSAVGKELREQFTPGQVCEIDFVDVTLLADLNPDLVLLHNTPAKRAGDLRCFSTLCYLHSKIVPTRANAYVSCSEWLRSQVPVPSTVLYQPVPCPPHSPETDFRPLEETIRVGRICSPQQKKWPAVLPELYRELAGMFPRIEWEFVGCPPALQDSLKSACAGRARFHLAGWNARQHYWRWHAMLYHHPGLTESFGRVAAEAMLAGCVPILDRRGGFCEQVLQGETGFLCGQRKDFVVALQQVSDSAGWWRLTRQARDHARNQFSLQSFRNRFLQLLRQELC